MNSHNRGNCLCYQLDWNLHHRRRRWSGLNSYRQKCDRLPKGLHSVLPITWVACTDACTAYRTIDTKLTPIPDRAVVASGGWVTTVKWCRSTTTSCCWDTIAGCDLVSTTGYDCGPTTSRTSSSGALVEAPRLVNTICYSGKIKWLILYNNLSELYMQFKCI